MDARVMIPKRLRGLCRPECLNMVLPSFVSPCRVAPGLGEVAFVGSGARAMRLPYVVEAEMQPLYVVIDNGQK